MGCSGMSAASKFEQLATRYVWDGCGVEEKVLIKVIWVVVVRVAVEERIYLSKIEDRLH